MGCERRTFFYYYFVVGCRRNSLSKVLSASSSKHKGTCITLGTFVAEVVKNWFTLLNEKGPLAVFPAYSEHWLCPHIHTWVQHGHEEGRELDWHILPDFTSGCPPKLLAGKHLSKRQNAGCIPHPRTPKFLNFLVAQTPSPYKIL